MVPPVAWVAPGTQAGRDGGDGGERHRTAVQKQSAGGTERQVPMDNEQVTHT